MRRRGATVAVGVVLLVLLVWQAFFTVKVPYVELSPGLTVDTLGKRGGTVVISVKGAPTTNSAGQLRMTTVSVSPDLTLVDAIRGWLEQDSAVVPRELVYPPDRSRKEIQEEDAQQFKESQTSAETAALRKLGYPVQVAVKEVRAGSPAEGVLSPGDVITAVDGTPVTSASKLTELIRSKPAGTARTFDYLRAGASATVSLSPKAEDGNPRIGVTVEHKQPHPFELKIELERIGGPSAGLLFALGIIDKIDPADLTGGAVIAGTGTIDDEGNVGPVGGVPQKLIGARRDGAKVFLTPADNCAAAAANPVPGLMLVRVATLDDAVAALAALRENRQPTLCSR